MLGHKISGPQKQRCDVREKSFKLNTKFQDSRVAEPGFRDPRKSQEAMFDIYGGKVILIAWNCLKSHMFAATSCERSEPRV